MSELSIFRRAFPLAALTLLGGCKMKGVPILDPAGPVALAERDLLIWAFALMMIVVVPVFAMTAWFAFRYRDSNAAADYTPDWNASARIEWIIWLVPALIVIALATLVWNSTHKLDPYRPLASHGPQLRVQAIAQDWKWVFIYPDINIATVNELAMPVNVPVSIEITADTVMNALYIPRLAGQIYAMAGMRTRLNLLADRAGDFTGRNSQYSGKEFARQRFAVRAMSKDDFATWTNAVKKSASPLDNAAYDKLYRQRAASPVLHFGTIVPGLFERTVQRYTSKPSAHTATQAPHRREHHGRD